MAHTLALFFRAVAKVLGPEKRANVNLFLRLSGAEGLVMFPLMSRVSARCSAAADDGTHTCLR